MIFKRRFLDGIKQGKIKLAFRRWKKATVRSNGRLMTTIGQLQIRSVEIISTDSITEHDALAAGYTTRTELIHDLDKRKEGAVYRIELGELKADPRVRLRQSLLTAQDAKVIREKLQRMDARADKPWTIEILQLIESLPAIRAADLCTHVQMEKMIFKANVRKLKNLGLTESLETGYRLSPRGTACLKLLAE